MANHATSTCWTLIEQAAAGNEEQRNEFARLYSPAILAFLTARWRSTPLISDVDDVCQEVLLEFLKDEGPLQRAERTTGSGFRGFLYGVTRNVALRAEERGRRERARTHPDFDWGLIGGGEPLDRVFDRAWAQTMLREAADRQAKMAVDDAARRRHRLLEIRFHDQKPIREIATLWSMDPTLLHREYAKARQEFKQALTEVLSEVHPELNAAGIEDKCRELLTLIA